MRIRISLRKGEREALLKRLHQAYAKGEVRLTRRIHALLYFFEGKSVTEIVELLGLSGQTIYNYLKAFILNRLDSLVYKRPPGPFRFRRQAIHTVCCFLQPLCVGQGIMPVDPHHRSLQLILWGLGKPPAVAAGAGTVLRLLFDKFCVLGICHRRFADEKIWQIHFMLFPGSWINWVPHFKGPLGNQNRFRFKRQP